MECCGSRSLSFILLSLESGHLDNSQQLAFSRRGSHHDSAQKYCRRRPSDKVLQKSTRETKTQTGGLCCCNGRLRQQNVPPPTDGVKWKRCLASPPERVANGDPVRKGGSNSGGRCTEGCADLHCRECRPMYQKETGVFIPYRGSSPPQFSGCLWENHPSSHLHTQ